MAALASSVAGSSCRGRRRSDSRYGSVGAWCLTVAAAGGASADHTLEQPDARPRKLLTPVVGVAKRKRAGSVMLGGSGTQTETPDLKADGAALVFGDQVRKLSGLALITKDWVRCC